MKKIILILIIIHCSLSIAKAQWFGQTLPVNGEINDIAFLNKDTGFVAMDNSNFLRTIDGGDNWSVMTSFRIEELEIIDRTTLYARAVNQSGFYQTFDGGTTWNYLAGAPYCAFSFINRDTGWFSAFSGIYKTTNGGVTANLISTQNNCCTKLMMLKEPYNGEYYGWSIQAFSFQIFKTTNSGVNWISVPIPSTPISIFFLNKDTGWVGVSSLTINLTTNAGVNWIVQPIPTVNSAAIEIYFVDFFRGWAGRGGFRIFATTNSGFPWGSQNSPVDGTTSITFIDSLLGWAGSFSIAKTTNGGGIITSIGIDSNNTNIPTSFKLNQNYPNPFNPQTTITFSLIKNSVVSLKIYDISGREILKLYDNANLVIGNYKAVIDFSKMNVSSGVYFYTLKVFDEKSKQVFNETKKMIYNK